MPTVDSETIDLVRATLKKERVFILQRLLSLLDCSRRTGQTRLSPLEDTYELQSQQQILYFPGNS